MKLIEAKNAGYTDQFLDFVKEILQENDHERPYFNIFDEKFELVDGNIMLKFNETNAIDIDILEL